MPRHLTLTRLFARDQAALDAFNQRQLGAREVPIAAISGTVGRAGLLRASRVRALAKTPRYRAMRDALEGGAVFPPVDLYLLAGSYYILDGHHRVAIARELGGLEIDATVVEFLPRAEPAASWHRDRSAFERDTGLTGLHIRQPGGYAALRHQLAAHCQRLGERACEAPATLRTAAADWARTVYRPAITELNVRRVSERAPDLTATELYLSLHDYATARGTLAWCGCEIAASVAAYGRARRLLWLIRLFGSGKAEGGRRK